MKPLRFIEDNKRIFAWIYDIWFLILIGSFVMIFVNEDSLFVYFLVSFVGMTLITLGLNIYYEYKEKNHTLWSFGIVLVQIIFVPLYYFLKLRPYWTKKEKRVYS